jgi:hypothetical protein
MLTARGLSGTGALSGERFSLDVGAYIGRGQLVLALLAAFEVGGQFVSGKDRAFLNPDAMIAEDCHIRRDRDLPGHAPLDVHVEQIHAGVLPLVKPEIPDVHEFPLFARPKVVSINSR